MAQEPRDQIETDVQESDPNASGPQGLTGDMGLSSERTGPEGSAPAVSGVQSTGTHGSAAHGTYGVKDTDREEVPDSVHTDEPDPERGEGPAAATGIDRTVGESNPAEVPPHQFDRTKSSGHSHG
jgi:hypothetical protein